MCLENCKFLCGTRDNTEIKCRPWETSLEYYAKHFYYNIYIYIYICIYIYIYRQLPWTHGWTRHKQWKEPFCWHPIVHLRRMRVTVDPRSDSCILAQKQKPVWGPQLRRAEFSLHSVAWCTVHGKLTLGTDPQRATISHCEIIPFFLEPQISPFTSSCCALWREKALLLTPPVELGACGLILG